MKKIKQNLVGVKGPDKGAPGTKEKLKKDRQGRKKNGGGYSHLPEPGRLHEKNNEDKMNDLYREEENRGSVRGV